MLSLGAAASVVLFSRSQVLSLPNALTWLILLSLSAAASAAGPDVSGPCGETSIPIFFTQTLFPCASIRFDLSPRDVHHYRGILYSAVVSDIRSLIARGDVLLRIGVAPFGVIIGD